MSIEVRKRLFGPGCSSARQREFMKRTTVLLVTLIAFGLASSGLAANHDDFAAKGYRWVTVDGPYGCPSRDDLQKITRDRTDRLELQFIEELRAYYLVRGELVKVIQQDAASGVSQIHAAEIKKDVWTLTKFLSVYPVRDAYGETEFPETEPPNSAKSLQIRQAK
jgi:hypothetical protein